MSQQYRSARSTSAHAETPVSPGKSMSPHTETTLEIPYGMLWQRHTHSIKQEVLNTAYSCWRDNGSTTRTHTHLYKQTLYTHRVQKQPSLLSSVHTWFLSSTNHTYHKHCNPFTTCCYGATETHTQLTTAFSSLSGFDGGFQEGIKRHHNSPIQQQQRQHSLRPPCDRRCDTESSL